MASVVRTSPASVVGLSALLFALVAGCAVGTPLGQTDGDSGIDPSSCGNGVLDLGETCDPSLPGTADRCDCYDGLPCTTDTTIAGFPDTCDVVCSHTEIAGCDIVCGDGQIDAGETCEDGTATPCTCDDGNPCTTDSTVDGSAEQCTLVCSNDPIASCSGVCGDGVLDAGETCEEGTATPCTCDDSNPCTTDTVVSGSAATCDLVCSNAGDACCGAADVPDDAFTDSDCDGVDGTAAQLVFVDGTTGSDANVGTQASPVKTITKGIELAAARLAGGMPIQGIAVSVADYDERVVLSPGVSVYGGYNRAMAWTRGAAYTPRIVTTAVQSAAASPYVEGIYANAIHATTVVDRFEVRPTSTAASPAGTSVYGVRVTNSSALVLRNVYVQAGPGRPGAAGAAGVTGAEGNDGAPANGRTYGAGAGNTTCSGSAAAGTSGGRGGTGGYDATPDDCTFGVLNGGLAGQLPTGISGCNVGTPGVGAISDDCEFPPPRDATTGGPGSTCGPAASALYGTAATSNGDIGDVQGGIWVSAIGNGNGAAGIAGPGGSGGGGGGAGDANNCTRGAEGGGGGGGGSGGCGGGAGGGGRGGGASIGLLAVDASSITVEGVTELRGGAGGSGGAGGAGGAGGSGGSGGSGGAGGTTAANACQPLNWPTSDPRNGAAGGRGGDGHAGGQGGGGQGGPGGPSVGILRCNSTIMGSPVTAQGTSGTGGAAGAPNGPAGASPNPNAVISGCSL